MRSSLEAMDVSNEVTFPQHSVEKSFIRAAPQKGIPMVRICLVAQLIEGALGARVYRNAHPKIGGNPRGALALTRPLDVRT